MARRRGGRGRRNSRGGRVSISTIILIALVFVGGICFLLNSGLFSENVCGSRGENKEKQGYCNVTNKDYDHLIIITGNTKNTPVPKLDINNDKKLEEKIKGIFYQNGGFTVISAASGNDSIDLKSIPTPANNISASDSNFKLLIKNINDAIMSAPKRDGANYLGAISEAKSYITKEGSKNPLIIVIGSGLSDSGVLDFAHNDIITQYRNDSSYIDRLLASNSSIVGGKYSGLSVTLEWYGISKTTAPQSDDIQDNYKNDIVKIYTEAINYIGISNTVLEIAASGSSNESVKTEHFVQPVIMNTLKVGDVFNVNDTISKFDNDSAKLNNEDEVKLYLRAFANKFDITKNYQLTLTGYVDKCDVKDKELGLKRANKIRSLLVDLGIPSSKIETRNGGGVPPKDFSAEYACEDDPGAPDDEQRTVRIEVK